VFCSQTLLHLFVAKLFIHRFSDKHFCLSHCKTYIRQKSEQLPH
jgi:hypothetical protein